MVFFRTQVYPGTSRLPWFELPPDALNTNPRLPLMDPEQGRMDRSVAISRKPLWQSGGAAAMVNNVSCVRAPVGCTRLCCVDAWFLKSYFVLTQWPRFGPVHGFRHTVTAIPNLFWLQQAVLCRRLLTQWPRFDPVHGFRHTVTAIPNPMPRCLAASAICNQAPCVHWI